MKQLSPSFLKEMTRRLVDQFQPAAIIPFGSYAWGTPGEYSDVDLLMVVSASDIDRLGKRPNANRASRTRLSLSARCPGAQGDILVKTRAEVERYRHVRASLESEIFERGEMLYERR